MKPEFVGRHRPGELGINRLLVKGQNLLLVGGGVLKVRGGAERISRNDLVPIEAWRLS
jgi:hypothetical protein